MFSWKGRSRGGSLGHRFFISLINKFGIKFSYFFLLFVVVHFIPFAPLATRSNWKYYRNIHHYNWFKTIKMLYVNYFRFGQVMIDKIAVRSGYENKYNYEFENYEAFLNVLDHSKGAILIGAHIGNWEIGGNFFGDYGKKINIVMYDAEYRKIKEIYEKNLNPVTHKIIPISEDNFEHIYQIKNALDNQEYVCFQGDRFIRDKTSKTIDFMGKPAKFPLGPFLLAGRFDVPVVFYFSMRNKGMKYKFKFTIAETNKMTKTRQRVDELLHLYVDALEKTVKEYPEQWFNYYPFWEE
jgi:predicted LPLAT superfamily acyltransferase